ncbi:hypothetical protein GCM10028808_27370 [Spirosoma migulaei]
MYGISYINYLIANITTRGFGNEAALFCIKFVSIDTRKRRSTMIFPLNPTIRRDDRLTDNEFYAFCQANPDLRLERDENGQIYIEMPTGSRTSIRNLDLAAEVYLWNRQHKAGIVTESNGGFTLPDTSVRVPYVAWVSNERWNALSEIEKDNFA